MNQLGMTYTTDTPLDYRGSANHTVKININGVDKEYCVIQERWETRSWFDEAPMSCYKMNQRVFTYELVEVMEVKAKSKEEIAAEESVTKAKEALKAAENALKVVKESK